MRIFKIKRLMKKQLILLLTIIAVILSYGISSAEINVDMGTGFQYDYWKDDDDNKGSQFYIPLSIGGKYSDFSLNVLTGYAETRFKPKDSESSTVTDFLDTKLNLSYVISGKLPVDILLGLDLNLPTGKTNLRQDELAAKMDPDLISINRFGEGFNINPMILAAKEWGPVVTGIGFGYLRRGEYDVSETLKEYDPGDIYNASAEIIYYFIEDWYAQLFGNYALYGKDTVKKDDFYEEGDFTLIGGGLHYAPEGMDLGLTVKGIFRDKSKFLNSAGDLVTEGLNHHRDEWVGDLTLIMLVDDETTAKASLQYLRVKDNEYPEEDPESSGFIGQRRKISLEAGGGMKLNPHLKLDINGKIFYMKDGKKNFPVQRDAQNYLGLSAGVFLTAMF